ncbi:hypothetical protein OF83DRAFT_1166344 [Amylostereum chailletii]|nr:hypothetical protein OF83DRAFT_1166344 [Amylostereum chailletii]
MCDAKGIPEDERCPASPELLLVFMFSFIGAYSRSTITNYASGVCAWHLNLASPFDVSVWACATSLFYGVGRTGELTTKTTKFDAAHNPTIKYISKEILDDWGEVTSIKLPHSKSMKENQVESIHWFTFTNHIQVNVPGVDEHLFTYTDASGSWVPLAKAHFVKHIKKAFLDVGIHFKQCHGFRIGGTVEYLIRSLPFEVMRAKGRWASNAFLVYMRWHAAIITPWIQAKPPIHRAFLRYVMPPVC